MFFLALILAACGRQAPPAAPPPPPVLTWQDTLAAAAPSGLYVVLSIEQLPINSLPPSQLVAAAMLQTYGAARLYVAAWTCGTDRAAAALRVYMADMPSPLHAYGLYSEVPAGADQTALRGGPSKRVQGTLVGMKGSFVFWIQSNPRDGATWLESERLFSCVAKNLPGAWALPAEVCSLGRMVPPPASIALVKENYLGVSVLGPALVARFADGDRATEVFALAPPTITTGEERLQEFRAWLADNGITGVQVEQGGTAALFVRDARLGALYLALDGHGLRGVHGAPTVAAARSILDQWRQLEEE
jgi:hypothetical protein